MKPPHRPERVSYDVAIIGGAAVGSATAWFLASNPDFSGSVLVIERDWTYARSATALSTASIRHQFSNPLNVEISLFGTEFIRNIGCWPGLEGSADLAFQEKGYLFLAASRESAELLTANGQMQRQLGADIVTLQPEDLHAQFPWLNCDGLLLGNWGRSGEGWFDNHGYLQALRSGARKLGVEYIQAEAASIYRAGGRVTGVTLGDGSFIAAGTVVIAAGTRAPDLARTAGVELPVEPRKRHMFVFDCREALAGTVPLTIDPSGVFFRPEGRYYLAGTTPDPDPAVNPDDFEICYSEFEEAIWPVLAERVPAFEAIRLVNAWAGHYDYCTLDQNALVGRYEGLPNLIVASGFSGHGLQQSPAVGRGIAELIVHGGYRSLDLSPLSYERVTAGRPFLEKAVV